MLHRNPNKRLGSGKHDAEEIKRHDFFRNINWKEVEARKMSPPKPEQKKITLMKIPPSAIYACENEGEDNLIPGWSFATPIYYPKEQHSSVGR